MENDEEKKKKDEKVHASKEKPCLSQQTRESTLDSNEKMKKNTTFDSKLRGFKHIQGLYDLNIFKKIKSIKEQAKLENDNELLINS